ncbi:hypothetical protein FHETE_6251 [Fusarium heterosporum]|uniref:Uncharacterized protein n=1 Tax=Fusarium heterosporum TaxID=42747 RepID=A0A8H5TD14_FUSHE|nr:hypothetical protein FHETE_6251 [Fusarium heterosporum]
MVPPVDALFKVGINGIKARRSLGKTYVYFSTTARYSIYLVPVTQVVQAADPVETLLTGTTVGDFLVARDGTTLGCTMISNTIFRVPAAGGEAVTVAGDEKSLTITSATAYMFNEDEIILNASASGDHAMPVDGKTEPANVAEVKLR